MTKQPPSDATRRLSGSRQVVAYPPPASDTTTLPTEDLRILFDALCGSMDFGSGFLDTPEVEALRRVAAALGVDPITATPSEFGKQYPHTFKERSKTWPKSPWADKCDHCDEDADHQIHQQERPA